MTECPWVRWRCAGGSTCLPPTAPSAGSGGWSSSRTTIASPMCSWTKATSGAKRGFGIPISAVKDVAAGVQLNLTKDEVRNLPPVEVDDQG